MKFVTYYCAVMICQSRRVLVIFAVLLSVGLIIACDGDDKGTGTQPVPATWTKTLSGSNVVKVATCPDGGIVLIGSINDAAIAGVPVYLVHMDESGDVVWSQSHPLVDNFLATDVTLTDDGGYAVAGFSRGAANQLELHVLITNGLGDTVWTHCLGNGPSLYDRNSLVARTADGGFVIHGQLEDEYRLTKLSSTGEVVWSRSSNYSRVNSIVSAEDGGHLMVGVRHNRAILQRTDALGDTIWTRFIEGEQSSGANAVVSVGDGNFVVAGSRSVTDHMYDVFLLMVDANGTPIWERTYGGPEADHGFSVAVVSDGGYIVTGLTTSFGAGSADIYLIRTNAVGDSLWTATFGGSGEDKAGSVAAVPDGGFVIAGWSDGQAIVIKTDSNGLVDE